jgi:hypothetical protein
MAVRATVSAVVLSKDRPFQLQQCLRGLAEMTTGEDVDLDTTVIVAVAPEHAVEYDLVFASQRARTLREGERAPLRSPTHAHSLRPQVPTKASALPTTCAPRCTGPRNAHAT